MYVLGHDHVSDHGKTIANPHPFEDGKYQIAARGIAKQRLAPIAAPGKGMQTARAVITLQPQGMKKPYAQMRSHVCDK